MRLAPLSPWTSALLAAWCGCLTVAVGLLAAFAFVGRPAAPAGTQEAVLALKGAETPYSTPQTPPTSAWTPAPPKQRAPGRENQNQRAVPLIHLEMESLRQWKVVRAHAFSLDGDTAAAREPGLYHLYAQVTFSDLPSRPSPLAATLLRRAARGRDWRPVCRALGWAGGRRTLSLAKLERLSGGDRLRLDIAPDNATSLLFNGHATFFGAFKVSD